MQIIDLISNNYIEVFGAITGILYVFLEIRQNIWLWPVGIITSGAYIWIFFSGKLYADMSLQGYYLIISVLGWYWWVRGTGRRAQGTGLRAQGSGQRTQGAGRRAKGTGHRAQGSGHRAQSSGNRAQGSGVGNDEDEKLRVSRLKLRTGMALSFVFVLLFSAMWLILDRMTDSPVPAWDSLITSLSIVATWMLARKIYEHWFLWIIVNFAAAGLFFTRGLYPTVILYIVYCAMSFVGLIEWKKTLE